MISDEAVKAAAAKLRSWTDDEEDEFLIDMAADVLQAALPVLLEGKAEEIARVIDPDGYWERLDSCNHALATVQMNDDERRALTQVRDDELRCTAKSLAKANRIISILTGESDER